MVYMTGESGSDEQNFVDLFCAACDKTFKSEKA